MKHIRYDLIDAGIVGLIRELNLAGYETDYSCQGDRYSGDPHGGGIAYVSFVNDIRDEIIDQVAALGLGVTLTQFGDTRGVAVYSQPTYNGSPPIEHNVMRIEDSVCVVTYDRVGINQIWWSAEERRRHNQGFQDKVRLAFGLNREVV